MKYYFSNDIKIRTDSAQDNRDEKKKLKPDDETKDKATSNGTPSIKL